MYWIRLGGESIVYPKLFGAGEWIHVDSLDVANILHWFFGLVRILNVCAGGTGGLPG